jgi:hypothetical protein
MDTTELLQDLIFLILLYAAFCDSVRWLPGVMLTLTLASPTTAQSDQLSPGG